jgi:uncharacterized cupredoxin-like copper-binding protein/Cu/Ag efflux protein CusF
MKTRYLLIAIPGMFAALTAMASGNHKGGHDEEATGKPGVASKVTRTISMDMGDTMRFSVPNVTAKQGETIRFVVKNSGKIKHEMVLGTEKELKEHSEVMKKNPEMEHADANMVTVAPGKTGEIIWQFTKAGKVDFACLQPGHYDAGMKGSVTVSDNSPIVKTQAKTDAAQPSPNNMTEGEIRKVDMDNKKITIKHGEIKNLDMPGMTMVFQVKDPAMLDKVKAGDKILFSAEKASGALVVTDIQPAK